MVRHQPAAVPDLVEEAPGVRVEAGMGMMLARVV
jgi:hypothetical protein